MITYTTNSKRIKLTFIIIILFLSSTMIVICQNADTIFIDTCYQCVKNPYKVVIKKKCCSSKHGVSMKFTNHMNDIESKNDFHDIMRIISNPSTNSTFTNIRKVFDGYQKKPFLLDSEINLPIAVKVPGFYSTFHIIPRFKFRIFQNDNNVPYGNGDQSLPVRTPSAMPGIAYYFTFKEAWNGNSKSKLLRNKYFGVYAYHHSNGQDGEEIDIINDDLNLYNGNFSEGLIFEFILGGKKIFEAIDNPNYYLSSNDLSGLNNQIGAKLTTNPSLARRELYWRIGYEWHPNQLTNKVFDELNILSKHRITYNISLLQMPTKVKYISNGEKWCLTEVEKPYEKWRHVIDGSFLSDLNYYRGKISSLEKVSIINISKRLNINYTCYYVLGESRHAALFGQIGYIGSDDYNIYLNESYLNLRLGLAFGFFHQP